MSEAIEEVFHDATHRLCGWHLQKNAFENMKSQEFLHDFKKALYSYVTLDRF